MDDQASTLAQEIVEGFDPNLISALYKNFTNQYIALEELIDNAVDDRSAGRILIINISLSEGKLIISNVNGKGMSYNDLVNFFQWGKSTKVSKIGRFGQGGKAAIGYLCKNWTLRTKAVDSNFEYYIEIEDWEDRSTGLKRIMPKVMRTPRSGEDSVVKFELKQLKRDIDIHRLGRDLREIYRPLLIKNEVEFILNGEKLEVQNINYDEGTLNQFSRDIRFNDMPYRIVGEYGIVSDTKSPRAGIRCYQYGRLIAKNEYFGHVTPHSKWALERLSGDLYIDFPVDLLMNKTNIDRDSVEWKAIKEAMYDELKNVVRLLQGYREPTSHEVRTVNRVGDEIKRVDDRTDIKFKVSNYGKTQLFKVSRTKDGIDLIINREFPAYKLWSEKPSGEKLYMIMIYSLFQVTEKLSKKESSILINAFAEALMKNCTKLLE